MSRYRLSMPALKDVAGILAYTEEKFGQEARERYQALIATAIMDLAADPERLGSRALPELGEGVRMYHLRHSREQARTRFGLVYAPRHIVVYRRTSPDLVEIGRILHDAMDIARHVPDNLGEGT